jgi:glucosamine--fructose-6-phosphate aminotransferase (isomerizing)
MPVVVIAPRQGHYDKIVSIQEIKSRSGRIIAVVTKGDTQVRELAVCD